MVIEVTRLKRPGARRFASSRWASGLMIAVATAACSAAPAEPATWSVDGRLWGKPKKNGGYDPAEDVSGLACAPETAGRRTCLLVDDESQGAQIVVLREGGLVAGDLVPLISDTYDGKPVELDAEAVAYADGAFYVTGSHGRARHEVDQKQQAKNVAKAAASRRVFRIHLSPDSVGSDGRLAGRAKPEVTQSWSLVDVLLAQPTLKSAFDRPLDANGLTIEGLAVSDGNLTVGFRGPVIEDEALLLTVPLATMFEGQPGGSQLQRLELGRDTGGRPRGIRDLVAIGEGVVGIAGPVSDPPDGRPIRRGDYAVFKWKPTELVRCQILEIYGPDRSDRDRRSADARTASERKPVKPEGLTLLTSGSASIKALLTFDGPEGGRPTALELVLDTAPACAKP